MNVWTLAVGQCASAAQKQQEAPKGNCAHCGKPRPAHRWVYCTDACMRLDKNQKRATTRAGRKAKISKEQQHGISQ